MDYRAADTPVAHEHVAALAQDRDGQALFMQQGQERTDFGVGAGCEEPIRRSSQTEAGQWGQGRIHLDETAVDLWQAGQ